MGLGGKEEVAVASLGAHLIAIDYKTGQTAWSHQYPSAGGAVISGILTTAGKLLFAGDNEGNLIAFDPADGRILWHSRIGQVSNAPETYMLDGHQYILAASGDMLFAFTLY
jgi:alcohol dehydrogenase (cytochrome c)